MPSWRVSLFILFSQFANFTLADTEFENTVPFELANALLSNPSFGELKIYSDILSDFPDFELPADFEVLGSVDQGYSQRVVLQTQLDSETATAALAENFNAQGFSSFDRAGSAQANVGFIAGNIPTQTTILLCHDEYGHLASLYTERFPANIVTLSISPETDRKTCSDQLAEQQLVTARIGYDFGLRAYLPRLEVPDEETSSAMRPAFLMSGSSNNGVDSDYNLTIDWTMEQVYQHFASQIAAQDWQLDSQALGDITATGIWTKSPESDVNLVGTLNIVVNSDSEFELKFSLRRR